MCKAGREGGREGDRWATIDNQQVVQGVNNTSPHHATLGYTEMCTSNISADVTAAYPHSHASTTPKSFHYPGFCNET